MGKDRWLMLSSKSELRKSTSKQIIKTEHSLERNGETGAKAFNNINKSKTVIRYANKGAQPLKEALPN